MTGRAMPPIKRPAGDKSAHTPDCASQRVRDGIDETCTCMPCPECGLAAEVPARLMQALVDEYARNVDSATGWDAWKAAVAWLERRKINPAEA